MSTRRHRFFDRQRIATATLILHGAPPCALWEIFQDDLAADFASNLAHSAAVNAALKSIDLMLHKHGRSTDDYGLPKVNHENTEYDRLLGAFDLQEIQELAINSSSNLHKNIKPCLMQSHPASYNKEAYT